MIKKEDFDILESAKCRQIVNEIMNFGVSQTQIVTLISLLAMELEDREKMLAVKNCLHETSESNASKIIT
tara:strand:+ start:538 stop:747 length:210 start_codon:yes stop_codon:yes gene_type:complete